MKILVTGFLAQLLILSTAPSLAAEAGRVLLASGDVVAIRGQQTVKLGLGSAIQDNDLLRTGPASHLHVRFADEAIVSMRENSELRIDEFRFTGKEDGSERMFTSLLKGGLRTITGLIGKTNHQNYRMSTSTAAIGIRGTDFSATLCQQDCRNADGSLALDGLYGRTHGASSGTNKINVSNAAGSRLLGINENFYVADNKSAVQPILAPPAFLLNRPQPRQGSAPRSSGANTASGGKESNASATKEKGGGDNSGSPDTASATTKSAQGSTANAATDTASTTTKSTGGSDTNTSTNATASGSTVTTVTTGTPNTAGNANTVAVTNATQEGVTVTASSGFQAESRLSSLPQPTVQLQFISTENLTQSGTSAPVSIASPTIAALGAYTDPNSTDTSQGGAFFSPAQVVTDPANAASTLSMTQQLTGFSVSGGYEAVTMPNSAKVITGSTTSSFVIDETSSNPINAKWGRWMSGSFSSGATNTVTLSSNNQFHYLYGPLTPPEVIAAKSGTVSMVDFYGTTPTNQAGQSGQISFSGPLNVNFTARTADIPQVTMTFSSNSEQYSFQSVTAAPIQIRTGQGAFINSTALGTYTQGQSSASARLGITGIFMGTSGDHLGVSLHAKTTSGTAASAQAVRLFTCSPC